MSDQDFELANRIEDAVWNALEAGWSDERVKAEVQNAIATYDDQ